MDEPSNTTHDRDTGKAHIACVIPVIPVEDVERSIEFYEQKLGYKLNWKTDSFASVSRNAATLFLCADEQGHRGTWVWMGVSDVDVICAEYEAAGVTIHNPPQNFQWGYEVQIADIDGNVLRLSSDPKKGPLGVWKRDDGSRWQQLEGGSWTRVSS